LRDAIVLVMDSYALPGDLRLAEISVGNGPHCCRADGSEDAITRGGPQCGGGPITICFCRARVPRTAADYDHFVRISGHELIHVPQCAAGTGNSDVDEFEAYAAEACDMGRAPNLSSLERLNHAQLALNLFAHIPMEPVRIGPLDLGGDAEPTLYGDAQNGDIDLTDPAQRDAGLQRLVSMFREAVLPWFDEASDPELIVTSRAGDCTNDPVSVVEWLASRHRSDLIGTYVQGHVARHGGADQFYDDGVQAGQAGQPSPVG